MANEFYVNMCKVEVEKNFYFKNLVLNCFEEGREENTLYFDCIKTGGDVPFNSEIRVTHDKEGHWTEFSLEYRLEGNEDWIFLDRWQTFIK